MQWAGHCWQVKHACLHDIIMIYYLTDLSTCSADERVENGACFQWQSQMRYAVSEKTKLSQVSRALGRLPCRKRAVGTIAHSFEVHV